MSYESTPFDELPRAHGQSVGRQAYFNYALSITRLLHMVVRPAALYES